MKPDVIVVGSGFGGAVQAARLAMAGRSVVVLERGRRWSPDNYPRTSDDDWVYDIDEPHRQNGWIDLRFLDDMWVAQGAGVGGGSLIYANVCLDAQPQMFDSGWPSAISSESLQPFYARVGEVLKPELLPDTQLTPRYHLMREAAQATGAEHRFQKVPLAVSFDAEASFPQQRPNSEQAEREFRNAFGRTQGYCVHTGNCDIGCKARAKNTLDLNYLAMAEDAGADIRPLCIVSHVTKSESGYTVHYDKLADGHRERASVSAAHVVLAAGSLGSTEILFRSRDQFRGLPDVSAALGSHWSSNGDFLTPAIYPQRELSPTRGPTITAAIDYLDGSQPNGARYFVEDGGFPDVLGYLIMARQRRHRFPGRARRALTMLARAFDDGDPLEHVMPWFGQAMDGGDGRLYFSRDWLRPWKKRLKLDWDVARSRRGVQGLIDEHRRLSEATQGRAIVPPTWSVLSNLVTPHPLGGCCMAAAPGKGVVNDVGEVFGYPGLYVSDGAIVPRPIGLNPSKTIAALAERSVESVLRA